MRPAAALLAAVLAFASTGCRRAEPQPVHAVFHYELSVDGVKRDSTFAENPLRAELGKGRLLAGIEEQLLAMRPGEERTVSLPPEKAYGPRDPLKVETMKLSEFGEMAARLAPGARVLGTRQGRAEKATVEKVEGGVVTLDFNPPDAGKTLTLRLRLVSREP